METLSMLPQKNTSFLSHQHGKEVRAATELGTPDGMNLKIKKACVNNTTHHLAEALVMVVDSSDQGRMLQAFLDTGCSKLIILSKFTDTKQRTKLK